MRYRMPAVALLGAVALAAAGCGGGSNSSEASGTTDTVSTEVTTQQDTTATDTTGSTDTTMSTDTTSTTDTTATTDTTGSAAIGLTGECKDLAAAGEKYAAAIGAASGSSGQGTDLEAAAKAYQQFADAAPEAIRDDLKTIAGMLAVYAKELKGVDLSSGQVPSAADLLKIQKAVQKIQSADVAKAEQNISAWVTQNCTTK